MAPEGEVNRDETDEIVADYIDRMNRGERFTPEAIRAAHPELAEEVLDHLEMFIDLSQGTEEPERLGSLGDYVLKRRLGRGGMGVVYEAWESSMDRRVALKVLPSAIAADDRAVTRFIREARAAGRLNHPNLVSVYGIGVKDQVPYYAMEYVEGETLAQVIATLKDAEPDSDTPFGKKDQVGYFAALASAFADAADGLQHAHSRQVIHRDIKPSNLILDSKGRLRILDFGLARLEGQESITLSGDVVGTPQYMSPEQARRKKIPVDHRTDVYSLGATLYEILTLQPPFRGKDHEDTLSQIIERDPVEPRKINTRVPKDLETIVLKCLRRDAGDRYGTAEAMGQDLRRFVRGDPVEARPEAALGRFGRRLYRQRAALGSLVLAAGFLVVSAVAAMSHLVEQRRRQTEQYERDVIRSYLSFQLPSLVGGENEIDSAPLLSFAGLTDYRGTLVAIQDAVNRLAELAAMLPDRPEAYYQQGRGLLLLRRRDEADRALRRALAVDPGFVPARLLLADASGEASRHRGGRGPSARRAASIPICRGLPVTSGARPMHLAVECPVVSGFVRSSVTHFWEG